MGEIYSRSRRTLAWLGEERDEVVKKGPNFVSELDDFLTGHIEEYRMKAVMTSEYV